MGVKQDYAKLKQGVLEDIQKSKQQNPSYLGLPRLMKREG